MKSLILCTTAFALMALQIGHAEAQPAGQPPKVKPANETKIAPANGFQGRIERLEVDARRITLNDVMMLGGKQQEKLGASMTFAVAEHARIWLDGREAQLRDLKEGFSARVETRHGNAPADRAKTGTRKGQQEPAPTGMRVVDLLDARSR